MEAQSRNNAWKIVQERMQENMATLQKLLHQSRVVVASDCPERLMVNALLPVKAVRAHHRRYQGLGLRICAVARAWRKRRAAAGRCRATVSLRSLKPDHQGGRAS